MELLKNETNSKGFSMVYHNLAISLAMQGKYDASNEAADKAIATQRQQTTNYLLVGPKKQQVSVIQKAGNIGNLSRT